MNRREMLLSTAAGLSASLLGAKASGSAPASPERSQLGVCVYCRGLRIRAERSRGGNLDDPLNFLEHCYKLGAGGIQIPLKIKDEAYTSKLRRRAEEHAMFVEGIAGLPRDRDDVQRFAAEVETARRAGATVIRVVMIPGRRYERFNSLDEFREFSKRGTSSLELAEPVAARHRMRLAVENHKDQRVSERLEVLRRIDSEYVGACVDTGNSFVLMEDPVEVVRAYAPWAFSVHLKDQAVTEYEDGFLFADVALGKGFLDLPEMVRILRKARPDVQFCLETITRDPLKVPCLTDKYWATFPDVPGRDMARTLRIVRANASSEPLPRVSHLGPDEQVAREDENVMKSLACSLDRLNLAAIIGE